MVDVYSLVLLSNSFRKYFRTVPYINWGCPEILPSFLFNMVSCIFKFLFCSPHYFKYIKISALALLKMVSTAYETYVRSTKFLSGRRICYNTAVFFVVITHPRPPGFAWSKHGDLVVANSISSQGREIFILF